MKKLTQQLEAQEQRLAEVEAADRQHQAAARIEADVSLQIINLYALASVLTSRLIPTPSFALHMQVNCLAIEHTSGLESRKRNSSEGISGKVTNHLALTIDHLMKQQSIPYNACKRSSIQSLHTPLQ